MTRSRKKEIFMPENHMEKLYRSANPLVKYAHNNRLDSIVDKFPSHINLKVLDAGCGEGHLIERLKIKNKSTYYGIDITGIALQKAKAKAPEAILTIGDISNLPFESEFFDVVICTEVLEHIPNYEKAIGEMKRVLKKKGTLIITFPNEILWTISRFLLGRHPVRVPDHVNFFTFTRIARLVNLPVAAKRCLPFCFPFAISLSGLITFKK
ncbi:MAG: class I SAM-dependent methyltransferase [Candidatus Omnitrophica bacterium]|nr:class I SAM-dependent methyltransferase [Candidatus Omnitrophota bacterium]